MITTASLSPLSPVVSMRRRMALLLLLLVGGCALAAEPAKKPAAAAPGAPAPPAASKELTAKGGAWFLVRVKPPEGKRLTGDMLEQAGKTLSGRLDNRRFSIVPHGSDMLYAEIRGMGAEEVEGIKKLFEKQGKLSFRLLGPDGLNGMTDAEDKTEKDGLLKLRYADGDTESKEGEKKEPAPAKYLWVQDKAELSGKCVKKAVSFRNPGARDYSIHAELHADYGEKMRVLTKANVSEPLAIVVDDEVISAPIINSVFGAQFEITGRFDEAAARTLASQLANPLETPVSVVNSGVIPSPAVPKKP